MHNSQRVMNIQEKYMACAIALAKKAEGMTSPNPMVGAILVKNGRVVGRGYHKRAGLAHAEINAMREAGAKARGATLYVTLEPCDHYGRTGPCTDAIIDSGIKDVVIAMKDPNPINNGRGIKRLNRCGIKTKVGVLEKDAAYMNMAYIKFVTKKMPFVTVKVAQSLDGKIATRTGDSRWISSEDSRRYVHELRRRSDAVMVGANTVRTDDPLLLSKLPGSRQPVRIIVGDEVSPSARIFSNSNKFPVIMARPEGHSNKRVDLRKMLRDMAKRGITNILVEGGGELAASLFKDGLVDKLLVFIAPMIIGGRDARTAVEGYGIKSIKDSIALKDMSVRRFKNDILVEAYVK